MLKKLLNHALVEFSITPEDPILVKSGRASVSGVEMAFVRTYRSGKPQPFIPGSSIKGVLRSYAEKICRSLRDDPVPVCLPYLDPGKVPNPPKEEIRQFSCGLQFDHYKRKRKIPTISSAKVYQLSCPTCRLFGSHGFVGRLATADAYSTTEPLIEERDGVAIDRLTGGAREGQLYDLEVLVRGEFKSSIEVRNFERWQLGLLALIFRDLEEGLVRLGFGKSRGLGRVKIAIERFELAYFNRECQILAGLGALCPEEIEDYGFFLETNSMGGELPKPEIKGLRYTYNIKETWKEVLAPAVSDLVAYVQNVPWPHELEEFVGRPPV